MSNPSNSKPLILVVEDDLEMNQLQCELLAIYDMDSFPAYSGAEAVEAFSQHSPDAVLLDLMLPVMDGFETCRKIRASEKNTRVPVILLTALDTEDCRAKGMEAGADAYFVKPFDPDEVIESLRKFLSKGQPWNFG